MVGNLKMMLILVIRKQEQKPMEVDYE